MTYEELVEENQKLREERDALRTEVAKLREENERLKNSAVRWRLAHEAEIARSREIAAELEHARQQIEWKDEALFALRAQIEAAQMQRPIAWVTSDHDGIEADWLPGKGLDTLEIGAKLYAAPVPSTDADRRDAERYRWLRTVGKQQLDVVMHNAGQEMDKFVDAAMAKGEVGK